MYCSDCGAKVEDKHKYCRSCGFPLDASLDAKRPPSKPLPIKVDSGPNKSEPDSRGTTATVHPSTPVTTSAKDSSRIGLGKAILIILGVLWISVIGLAVVYSALAPEAETTSTSIAPNLQTYTSTEHKFRVLFNGSPEISHDATEGGTYTIPFTTYSSDLGEGIEFQVTVYDYSGIPSDAKAAAELVDYDKVLARTADRVNGTLRESRDVQLGRRPGREGHFSIPWEGKEVDVYMRVASKHESLYTVTVFGADRMVIDALADSFEFTE